MTEEAFAVIAFAPEMFVAFSREHRQRQVSCHPPTSSDHKD